MRLLDSRATLDSEDGQWAGDSNALAVGVLLPRGSDRGTRSEEHGRRELLGLQRRSDRQPRRKSPRPFLRGTPRRLLRYGPGRRRRRDLGRTEDR